MVPLVKNKEKFVIATKLLTDSSGVKMGKTEGNMVSFVDNNFEMFGKVMSWTDDMMLRAERPETPMQIQMLLIYDQSTAPSGNGCLVIGCSSSIQNDSLPGRNLLHAAPRNQTWIGGIRENGHDSPLAT